MRCGLETPSPSLILLVCYIPLGSQAIPFTKKLLGSERARNAKTAGATLAEAGKINESLMYLGQCLQMQGDYQDSNKVGAPYHRSNGSHANGT